MNREEALTLIYKKEWGTLLSALKDNKKFDELISDAIFKELFKKYFIDEILTDFSKPTEDRISELAAVFNFHKSSSYKFILQDSEHEKLVMQLVDITGNYFYAKEYPLNPKCRPIIEKHERENEEKLKFVREALELEDLNKNLSIIEFEGNSNITNQKVIFNSPQEIEFYNAAMIVFKNEIILPNAALSTVLDNKILGKLTKTDRWLFLTTTVDFVIVDSTTYLPIYFFELDSGYHDSQEQIAKDEIKNILISESGYKLYRTRKNISGDKTDYFAKFLKEIKNSG